MSTGKWTMSRKARTYDRANAEAAARILRDPERYEGLPVAWALAWMQRRGTERKPPGKLTLFAGRVSLRPQD